MQDSSLLWYKKPASAWKEALPLGNGRLGAMVYGGIAEYPLDGERIDLSELSFFSGETSVDSDVPGAASHFHAARSAFLSGDLDRGEEELRSFVGARLNYGTNLPVGTLVIRMSGQELEKPSAAAAPKLPADYRRSLDIDTGLCMTEYTREGAATRWECFLSHPHQILALRVTRDDGAPLSLSASLYPDWNSSPESVSSGTDAPLFEDAADSSGDLVASLNAREEIHSDGSCGARFACRLRIVQGSPGEALLLLSGTTDFGVLDPELRCLRLIEEAALLGWEALLAAHLADLCPLTEACSLSLDDASEPSRPLSTLSTDERVRRCRGGEDDPGLAALLFRYGRYLLLSSSRHDSPLPAHLQGIWNDSVASRIGWTCDHHLDVNTQMNYWPAEATGLGECVEPLFRWMEDILIPRGEQSARINYGLSGWVAELVSNAWGFSSPYWHTNLAPCPACGVWTLAQFWERWEYGRDRRFLEDRAYPATAGAVEFFLGYLFRHSDTGELMSGPSISPENKYRVGESSYAASLSPTFELTLIRELFGRFLAMSEVLGIEDDLVLRARAAASELPHPRIGADGRLAEWSHDYPSTDRQHRHTSHLLGLYPFRQIRPGRDDGAIQAARLTLEDKLNPPESWEDTGWARASLLGYAVRMLDAQETERHVRATMKGLLNPNLMVLHPPTRGAPSFADVYELDGNTGFVAGLCEALVQAYDDEVLLLPALPVSWRSGSLRGLRLPGSVTLDLAWSGGHLQSVTLRPACSCSILLRYKEMNKRVTLEAEAPVCLNALW